MARILCRPHKIWVTMRSLLNLFLRMKSRWQCGPLTKESAPNNVEQNKVRERERPSSPGEECSSGKKGCLMSLAFSEDLFALYLASFMEVFFSVDQTILMEVNNLDIDLRELRLLCIFPPFYHELAIGYKSS